jgi:hypothetical protein
MRKDNLLGQQFERLTVIEEIDPEPGKPKRPRWKCKCDCGNIIIVSRTTDLKSGNTKSCGCIRSEKSSKRASVRNFENRKYDPKIAAAKRVYDDQYSDGTLTFEEFLELSQMNCWYCNSEPVNISKPRHKRSSDFYLENAKFIYNGLDRIDSKLPHDIENCAACCKWCNYAKRERTLEEFIKWIEKAYWNIQKKKRAALPAARLDLLLINL